MPHGVEISAVVAPKRAACPASPKPLPAELLMLRVSCFMCVFLNASFGGCVQFTFVSLCEKVAVVVTIAQFF